MEKIPFIIYGAGGHARVALDAARLVGLFPKWIVDDSPIQSNIFGVPIISSSDKCWLELNHFKYLVAVGSNSVRCSIFLKLLKKGGEPCTIIHPSATISAAATIGAGTVVMAGVQVNSCATIGSNVILNTGSSVDHDCKIGDHVHLCPGTHVAGTVEIGDLTMIGTGSCIIPNVKIGSEVVVGAGSVVLRNLPDKSVAYGNPARQKSNCK
jgi:sugar O-acyltransferase (sialic acid O-acetyltransferase NeuD family)